MEVQPVIDFQISRKTVIEMLLDRKYKITNPYSSDTYIEEDTNELYSKMNFEDSLIVGKKGEKKIQVYFLFEKIGIKFANTVIDTILREEHKHVILVCRGGFTTFAEQTIKDSAKKHQIDIETFLQSKLLFNCMKNFTQPLSIEHITDKNIIRLLHQTLGIKKKQNLLIQSSDPVNKYYHGKPGEMYKVMTRGGKVDYWNIV